MTEYDELMARRKKIHDAWMGRVYQMKKIHGDEARVFWGAGVVLDKDGTLRMTAFAPNSWDSIWDLTIEPGGEAVFHQHST